MPRCETCERSVHSSDLEHVGDLLICSTCRRPKLFKEEKMAEKKERKEIASVHIFEVPTRDGATDHEVVVEGNYAGLELKFTTTFDQVREFFTQKRATGQKARLKSV